jgi:outer membrane protein assembly factor BamB
MFFVALVLILIVVTSLLVLLGNNFLEQKPEPEPSISWQINLERFISDIVYDDTRVFVIDVSNVICLNKTNGEEIWRKVGNSGGTSKLLLYEDKVYAGTYGGTVTSFDKYTGEELLKFQAPVSTTWGGKSPPQDFFIEDGRLFVYQNGYAVYNATTAELFYEYNGWTIELGNASATASESSFIFITGYGRVNPNNGETIWSMPGMFSDPAVVSQDKVILWNYNPDELGYLELGQSIICVDASSGDTLWSYNVSSPMFQPTVYHELVLFAAYDGYFYALNLSSGELVWKTLAINQSQTAIIDNEGQDLTPIASPIQIETKKGTGVWSFVFMQNVWRGVVEYKVLEYVGMICEMDLASGQLLWTKLVEDNATISSGSFIKSTPLGLAQLNDYAFLTVRSNLYIVNTQTGSIFEKKKFEHNLLEPISTKNMVFVAEELHLTAYN